MHHTPSDTELFGRPVFHTSGVRLGRVDLVVHQLDGTRMVVVRRGRILRRWYFVSLDGARLDGDGLIVDAAYGRGRPRDGDGSMVSVIGAASRAD